MNKKYIVKLTVEERGYFERVAHTSRSAVWKILRAQGLLKLDQGAQGARLE